MPAARKGKQKKEKTTKYIEASALPVRNGARKYEKERRKQPESEQKRREALGMQSHLHAIPCTHLNIKLQSRVFDGDHLNAD